MCPSLSRLPRPETILLLDYKFSIWRKCLSILRAGPGIICSAYHGFGAVSDHSASLPSESSSHDFPGGYQLPSCQWNLSPE